MKAAVLMLTSLVAVGAACASGERGVTAVTDRPAAPVQPSLIGSWASQTPGTEHFGLSLTASGDTLAARLTFSGREMRGGGAVRGSRLQLTLRDGPGVDPVVPVLVDGSLGTDSRLRVRLTGHVSPMDLVFARLATP